MNVRLADAIDLAWIGDDHADAALTAVGYNFRLILKWSRVLSRNILAEIIATLIAKSATKPACCQSMQSRW